MELIAAFEGYVPLFQTLVWAIIALVVLRAFRTQIQALADALAERARNSPFKAKVGPLEFDIGELKDLKPVSPEKPAASSVSPADMATAEERRKQRQAIYQQNRDLFVTHVLTPAAQPGQQYDIYIYLIRHDGDEDVPKDLSDVVKAEFFFGSYWDNQIFTGTWAGTRLGVRTSAYGPFLCTCLVTFADGYQAMIYRYIDFEMGQLYAGK